MIKLNIHEVKTHLSKYLELVEGGETVVVCKRNIPIAEIRPLEKKKRRTPKLGWAEGQGKILPSFDDPLSESELSLWHEGHAADPLRDYAPKPKRSRK
jgi:antitoxin (DNA-binding transcriptional repressor) of toxin-antitoxin stability system